MVRNVLLVCLLVVVSGCKKPKDTMVEDIRQLEQYTNKSIRDADKVIEPTHPAKIPITNARESSDIIIDVIGPPKKAPKYDEPNFLEEKKIELGELKVELQDKGLSTSPFKDDQTGPNQNTPQKVESWFKDWWHAALALGLAIGGFIAIAYILRAIPFTSGIGETLCMIIQGVGLALASVASVGIIPLIWLYKKIKEWRETQEALATTVEAVQEFKKELTPEQKAKLKEKFYEKQDKKTRVRIKKVKDAKYPKLPAPRTPTTVP